MTEQMRTSTADQDLPEVYYLETLDQLKVLAEPIRYRMTILLETPTTAASLARKLGLTRPKAHYHLKQLEAVGLVRPHSEALNNGIVEKFYIVSGRILDFSNLMPARGDMIPDNVSPETVGAITSFLSAMLQVSGEKTRDQVDAGSLDKNHYFDFEAEVTPDQFAQLRERMKDLRRDSLAMARETREAGVGETLRFHMTNYLTAITADPDREPEADTEEGE